jgi:2'-5' RNA ligase
VSVTRIQLSLYVPEPVASQLEAVRQVLDPIQHDLIPAHVTLCREDELAGLSLELMQKRLAKLPMITLRFGEPEYFHEHGILLPCIAGEDAFRQVREQLLGAHDIRRQLPHITLAHPRNPKAAGNSLVNARVLPSHISVTFSAVHLIEQTGSEVWRIRNSFALASTLLLWP